MIASLYLMVSQQLNAKPKLKPLFIVSISRLTVLFHILPKSQNSLAQMLLKWMM